MTTPDSLARRPLSEEQQRALARFVAGIVTRRKQTDPSFKQESVAIELNGRLGFTKPEAEKSYFSSFLKGDNRGLRRYFAQGPSRQEVALRCLSDELGVSVDEMVGAATGGMPSGGRLAHPAWPELGDDTSLFLRDVPGLGSWDSFVQRARGVCVGRPLVIFGSQGTGKSTVLRWLSTEGVESTPATEREGARSVVDDCVDIDSRIQEAARSGIRLIAATTRRPASRGYVDFVELKPWGPRERKTYVARLRKLAEARGAPTPPPGFETWLETHASSTLLQTPLALGYVARDVADSGELPDGAPDVAARLVQAHLSAFERHQGSTSAPASLLIDACRSIAVWEFEHAAPGSLHKGIVRDDIRRAVESIARPDIDELRNAVTDAVKRLSSAKAGGGSASKARESLAELERQLQMPSGDDLLESLVAADVLVEAHGGVRFNDATLADGLVASMVAQKSDAWKLLVETLDDPSRDGVRFSSVPHLPGGTAHVAELLGAPIGTHVAALRFALALVAFGKERASVAVAQTVLASICSLVIDGWERELLRVDPVLLSHLEAASRRLSDGGGSLELRDGMSAEAFLATTTSTVRALLGAKLEFPYSAKNILEQRTPPWGMLGLPPEATRQELLAALVPWLAPQLVLHVDSWRRLPSVPAGAILWERANSGDDEAQHIATHVQGTEREHRLRHTLTLEQRLEAFRRWGLEDEEQALRTLGALLAEASSSGDATDSVRRLARSAVVEFVFRFSPFAAASAFPLINWRIEPGANSALWRDGLEEAKSVEWLEADRLVVFKRVGAGLSSSRYHQEAKSLLDLAIRLYRLGTREHLRQLALGRWPANPPEVRPPEREPAVSVEQLTMEAAHTLITARDADGLREGIKDDSPAMRALHEDCAKDAVAVWAAEEFDDLFAQNTVISRPLPKGLRREAVLRWARSPNSPTERRRLAARALLGNPGTGEADAVCWYLKGPVDAWSLSLALNHPDGAVHSAGREALMRTLKEAVRHGSAEEELVRWCRIVSPSTVERSIYSTVEVLRSMVERLGAMQDERATACIKAALAVTQSAARANSQPDRQLQHIYLLQTCMLALRAARSPDWSELLVHPFPGCTQERAEQFRFHAVPRVGIDSIDDRSVLRALQSSPVWASSATKRLLELEAATTKALKAELHARLEFLVSPSDDSRLGAVWGLLRAQAPAELAELYVEAAATVLETRRGDALRLRSEVEALSPTAGARFVEALFAPRTSPSPKPHRRRQPSQQ